MQSLHIVLHLVGPTAASAAMFKKPIVRASHTVLKSSVARVIRELVASTFPSLSPADLALLFPPKSPLLQSRLSSPTPCTVYSTSPSRPIFFSLSTPSLPPHPLPTSTPTLLLPTVYALWLCPHLLPPLFIPSPVSTPLLRGADLMLPGVLHAPALLPLLLSPYQPRAVLVRGNPAPFGVGLSAVSDAEAERGGWTGRGLRMVHVWGDELWAMGEGGGGNEGFKEGRVEAVWGGGEAEMRARVEEGLRGAEARGEDVEEWRLLKEQMEEKFARQAGEAKAVTDEAAVAPSDPLPPTTGPDPATASEAAGGLGEGAVAEAKDADEKGDEASGEETPGAVPAVAAGEEGEEGEEDAGGASHVGSAVVEEVEGDGAKVPVDAMDAALLEALLFAIKLRLSDDVFPLTPSVILDAMEAANPRPYRLDLKASSHKRMAAFVKAMQKRGLLHLKAKKTDVVITGVHHQHPEVRALPVSKDYDVALKAKTKAREKAERERRQAEEGEGRESKAVTQAQRQVTVHYRYKPDALLRAALFDEEAELRTMREVKERLQEYVKEEGLEEGGGGAVRVDGVLARLLPASSTAAVVGKAALAKAVEAHLQAYHALTLLAGQGVDGEKGEKVKWVKGEPAGVEVSLEQRQGRKLVTRVAGLGRLGVEEEGWAREAQRLFASSATVAEGVGKKGGGKVAMDVLIQGDWRHDIADKLHALYDIPHSLVHVAKTKSK